MLVITWDGRDPAYTFGGEIVDLGLPALNALIGKPWRQRQRYKALVNVLAAHQVKQAIAFMESAGVILAMAKSRALPELRTTVSVRSSPLALGRIARMQIRRWYPLVDRVVMQTSASVAQISKLGIPANRCTVVPNPLPTDWLQSVPMFAERENGLILAVGRLDPVKEFNLLLTAFARLKTERLPSLVILGEGPMRSVLMAQAQSLGIADRVVFPGRVTDVRAWLDRARVFVMTSRNEGFPNALAEAMARGCPVISTDCPTGPGEMIEHGRSGWLVPVGDAAALANAMTEALLDAKCAETFGYRARLRAEEWAIDQIAPRWLEDV